MNKLTLITISMVAALWSCKADNGIDNSDNTISISTSINGLVRATEEQFQENDVIKVYAYKSGDLSAMRLNGIDNTYNGIRWSTSESMIWEDRSENYDFLGVFPNFVLSGEDFTAMSYSLREQMEDNDILVATNTGVNGTGVAFDGAGFVALPFDHIMSKVTVRLIFKSDFVTIPTVERVVLKAKTSGTINFLTKAVSPTGDASDKLLSKVGDDYQTITVAQSVDLGKRMLEIYLQGDNVPYVFTTSASTLLESGKHRVFNLTVGADKTITLNSVTIATWGQSGELDGSAQQ